MPTRERRTRSLRPMRRVDRAGGPDSEGWCVHAMFRRRRCHTPKVIAIKDFDKWVSIEPNTGCWMWMGQITNAGYGRVSIRHRYHPAHRVFYEAHVGPIPDGLQIDHLCRHRWCVNPAHMEPVTCSENLRRGESPVGRNARKVHCVRGHAFDESNTLKLKGGGRRCRACHRRRARQSYRRQQLEEHN